MASKRLADDRLVLDGLCGEPMCCLWGSEPSEPEMLLGVVGFWSAALAASGLFGMTVWFCCTAENWSPDFEASELALLRLWRI